MSVTEADKLKLQALVRRREKYLARLTTLHDIGKRCQDNFSKKLTPNPSDTEAFISRFRRVEDDYGSFDEISDQIGDLNAKFEEQNRVEVTNTYAGYETMYFAVQSMARIWNINTPPAPTSALTPPSGQPNISQLRLPKIEIEPFDGSIEKWPNFYDLFNTLVHNNKQYSKIEKFMHLKSLLRSHALALVQTLPITSNNYSIALQTLIERFQSVRLLGANSVEKLLSFKPMASNTHSNLVNFLDIFTTNINALKGLQIQDMFDFFVLQLGLKVLPEASRREFEIKHSDKDIPKFVDLSNFIREQVRILELSPDKSKISERAARSTFVAKTPKTYPSKTALLSTTGEQKRDSLKCPKCKNDHKLFSCPEFRKMIVQDRHAFVKTNTLCYNCLGFHFASNCRSPSMCGECKKNNISARHHSLLHFSTDSNNYSKPANYSPLENAPPAAAGTSSTLTCGVTLTAGTTPRNGVLLSTAIIHVRDKSGIPRPVRAVLDSGSQTSLITEACVQKLGLARRHVSLGLAGIANLSAPASRGSVGCTVLSPRHPSDLFSTEALILSQISAPQPNFIVDHKIYDRFKHLQLADPSFCKRSPVEFLLGADLYTNVLSEPCEILKGKPAAIKTIFGWVIGGPIPNSDDTSIQVPLTLLTCCEQLDCSIKKLWEVEEVSMPFAENPDDVYCENHFIQNHTRDEFGRYCVTLPFTRTDFRLPSTRNYALKCFFNLEKRLKRQPHIFEEYRAYMDEFISSGHMSPARTPAAYVIPHHCVIKDSSTTTKVRTVFNASFHPDSSTPSLNDVLYNGPKLQKDICEIISAFRLGEVVVCCDLRQMYRQVNVRSDQRIFQHLFYRPSIDGDVLEYELNTLVFGVKPSAFLAQRTLVQLVADEGKNFPLASDAILRQTFVDNVCESVDSVETAITLQKQLVDLFNLGGFSLRKWASNRQEILDLVPVDFREHAFVLDENEDDQCIKILGLQYEPSGDQFSYSLNVGDVVNTKRGLLSQVARLFDPLGWLSPVIFTAKTLIQRTWLLGLGWDDPLPPEISTQWEYFQRKLTDLSRIRISRHMPLSSAGSCQLIGFCDASTRGYAAVIYARSEFDGDVQIHLIKAKSRLAPLKTVSVPRLELCGAVLLSRLMESIAPFRNKVDFGSVFLFTDSSTALSWIRTPPHKLKTFVSNRVVQILDHTSPNEWAHVSTNENPSDYASRGLMPDAILDCDLWWKGPAFLYTPINSWTSVSVNNGSKEEILAEFKKDSVPETLHVSTNVPALVSLLDRVSNITLLQRILARMVRSIRNFSARKQNCPINVDPLSPIELDNALNICIKATQTFHFSNEVQNLTKNRPVAATLMKLAPFVDEMGFLRVGGRLKHSNLPYSAKYPMILPAKSRLAALLCDYYHKITLHGGQRLVQSLIQRKFWILSIRQLLRTRLSKCLTCYKLQARPIEPLMSDLPAIRLQECRPFLNTGVDYAGPLMIKESHRRKAPRSKGYIVLFVCLSTRAVHLEFASSLSTPTFLAALDRFIARRGLCSQIFSDCGTNFRGAAHHFDEVRKFLLSVNSTIADHLALRGIKWNFITPAAPHQGGIWEAGVKSAKHHLIRVVGPLILTFEEMETLLARIEAVLNSRPLGSISSDPNDNNDYLSPGHFLIGIPLLSPPEFELGEPVSSLRDRYQILQAAAQCFWKRWSKDYIQTLIPREKWIFPRDNIAVGDVVYIQTPNTSPLQWPIGRVEETYPGKDGVVRNVKVKTATSSLLRPVQKLVALPPLESARPISQTAP